MIFFMKFVFQTRGRPGTGTPGDYFLKLSLILSKPDPDKEDLVNNAIIIATALDGTLSNNYRTLIEALALSYYEYKQIVNIDKLKENFHGNRDF